MTFLDLQVLAPAAWPVFFVWFSVMREALAQHGGVEFREFRV